MQGEGLWLAVAIGPPKIKIKHKKTRKKQMFIIVLAFIRLINFLEMLIFANFKR